MTSEWWRAPAGDGHGRRIVDAGSARTGRRRRAMRRGPGRRGGHWWTRVVGTGFNQPISSVDPTAHAEVVALRAAARALGNYRLTGAVYVTVEPCLMCVGAMIHARIAQVVFGAPEPKAGALVSPCGRTSPGLNHRLQVTGGVLEEECRRVMQEFFAGRRRVGLSRSLAARAGGRSGWWKQTGRVRVVVDCPIGSAGRADCAAVRRRGTEVVVTGAPRKRVVRKGTWVRIPPSPPT